MSTIRVYNMKYHKVSAIIAVFSLLFVLGAITYDTVNKEQAIVVISLEKGADPFSVLPQLPGTVTEVKTINSGELEVKITSHSRPHKLLDFIKRLSFVKDAKIKE